MKKITDICGPLTLATLVIYSILFAKLLFDYNFYEFCLCLAADFAMAGIAMATDPYIFRFFFPETKAFFPKLDEKRIAEASTDEKLNIFESICDYPKKRAFYMIPANIIKTAPSFLVMAFLWDHGLSYGQALFYCAAIILLTISYMSAMIYLENHYFLTAMVREIDKKYRWSDVFDRVKTPTAKDVGVDKAAAITIFGLCVWGGIMQIIILFDTGRSSSELIFRSIIVQCFMIAAIVRILLMSRRQLFLGLETTFDYFNDPQKLEMNLMPLNTVPAVIYQQKILNNLVLKIKKIEKEISDRILEWSEKRRFLDMGEISALVVHDLVNPMHSMSYCLESIKEKNIPQITEYVAQIDWGLKYATGLLQNLKNNLRISDTNPTTSCLVTADDMVRKIVRYHFSPGQTERIKFEVEKPEITPQILMPQPDLNQVMTNLYTNSIKNLVTNNIKDPIIRIKIMPSETEGCTILFSDNGTGMNFDDFHFFDNKPGERKTHRKGLGLKLTKRLIEYYNGSLSLSQNFHYPTGTSYLLRLPIATNSAQAIG